MMQRAPLASRQWVITPPSAADSLPMAVQPNCKRPPQACSCSPSQQRKAPKSSTTPKGCCCCQARHCPLGPSKFQLVQREPTTWAGKPNSSTAAIGMAALLKAARLRSGKRSITQTSTPALARQRPSSAPAGPAPTTSTEQRSRTHTERVWRCRRSPKAEPKRSQMRSAICGGVKPRACLDSSGLA